MVNAGHIEDIARGSFGPKRTQTFEQSAKTFEVRHQISHVILLACSPCHREQLAPSTEVELLSADAAAACVSDTCVQVLAEVLQQQARVDATDAAQRQIYER